MLPNAFKWDFFLKLISLKTVEAKVIIITRYVKPNKAMTINKSLKAKLDLLAEVTHIEIELKFDMKTSKAPFSLSRSLGSSLIIFSSFFIFPFLGQK